MTTRICGLLLVCLLLFGCAKSVHVPTTPTPQDSYIAETARLLGNVSTAATIGSSIVASLLADKQISKADAKAWQVWLAPLPIACQKAKRELESDAPREVRIANAAQIINDAQRAAIIRSLSPKLKAAYIGVTAALDAVAAQLNLSATER